MNNNKNNSSTPQYSEAYLIEKEKIKTRRTRNRYIFFGAIILAAMFALYFIVGKGGKGGFDVDITKGTFSFKVDKPVVEQAKTKTEKFELPNGNTIDYTTGTIDKQILDDFSNENILFSPYHFVGDNLVNAEAGYIITSIYPKKWHVQYNPNGLTDPSFPVNILTATDGSQLGVFMVPIMYDYIGGFIEQFVNNLFANGTITDYPYVSYADDGGTAFLTFTDYSNNGQSYMKVVEGYSYYYVVNADYNLDLTNYDLQDELIWMVANFTLIK